MLELLQKYLTGTDTATAVRRLAVRWQNNRPYSAIDASDNRRGTTNNDVVFCMTNGLGTGFQQADNNYRPISACDCPLHVSIIIIVSTML